MREEVKRLGEIVKAVSSYNEDLAFELVNTIADASVLDQYSLADLCIEAFSSILDYRAEEMNERRMEADSEITEEVRKTAREFGITDLIG